MWARHGQNIANVTGTLSYRVFDGDLTHLGREQAHELGRHLAASGRPFPLIAASPLRRALQTAEIIAEHLDQPAEMILEDLREINVGALDGRNDADSLTSYRRILEAWRDGDLAARFPGGEDGNELVERIRHALGVVGAEATYQAALVVAHGANLRAALPSLTGTPDPGRDLGTGEVARLEVRRSLDADLTAQLLSWETAY